MSESYYPTYAIDMRTTGPLFTPAWYAAHRGVWHPPGLAANPWTRIAWPQAAKWLDLRARPIDYDYRRSIRLTDPAETAD